MTSFDKKINELLRKKVLGRNAYQFSFTRNFYKAVKFIHSERATNFKKRIKLAK